MIVRSSDQVEREKVVFFSFEKEKFPGDFDLGGLNCCKKEALCISSIKKAKRR